MFLDYFRRSFYKLSVSISFTDFLDLRELRWGGFSLKKFGFNFGDSV